MAALPGLTQADGCFVSVADELPPSGQGEAVAVAIGGGALLTVS
jgi:hypothetical protein